MSVREGVWESKREDREGVCMCDGGRQGVVNLLVVSSVFHYM